MQRPADIPVSVWNDAPKWAHDLRDWAAHGNTMAVYDDHDEQAFADTIARAILAERDRAIEACEAQKSAFLSTEYAANQPLGSLLERFACDECIDAIRNPSPADSGTLDSLPAAQNENFARIRHMGPVE